MSAANSPTRRFPVLLAVIAIVCVAAFLVGRFLLRESGSENPRPPGPDAVIADLHAAAPRPDLAAPEGAAERSGAPAPALEPVRADEGVDEDTTEPEVRHAAWELLARLEELARTPKTFHAAALPVMDELTKACSTQSSPDDAPPGSDTRAVVLELQFLVVANPERDTLVRGAVFLALASLVPQAEFWGTFTEWTSGHPSVPLELVRAAALAAARIGSPSPCKFPLPLAKLAELPTRDESITPGFYPLALDRIASGRACDAIRRWLDLDDPRKSLFRISNSAPPASTDLASAGDYFVTVEVLTCIWGHRSLEDTLVERAVLDEAEFTPATVLERSLVNLLAAKFLVLSLARCNTSFLDAAVAMTSDSDDPLSELVSEMQSVLGEELGFVTIERLERLRYSQDSMDEGDLSVALGDLRRTFLRAEAYDPEQRAVLLDYLYGLVADPDLSWIVRVGAVNAIAGSGSWDAIRKAAAAAFQSGVPFRVADMALGPLMTAARSNPAHRAEALDLLRQFAAKAPASAAKLHVDAHISSLMQ